MCRGKPLHFSVHPSSPSILTAPKPHPRMSLVEFGVVSEGWESWNHGKRSSYPVKNSWIHEFSDKELWESSIGNSLSNPHQMFLSWLVSFDEAIKSLHLDEFSRMARWLHGSISITTVTPFRSETYGGGNWRNQGNNGVYNPITTDFPLFWIDPFKKHPSSNSASDDWLPRWHWPMTKFWKSKNSWVK